MIPTFGKKIDNKDYQARYGVYGIVARKDNTEICLVQAPNGAYFLPGGEIEAGEDHKKALIRELHEELGRKLNLVNFLGNLMNTFILLTGILTIIILPISTKQWAMKY
jgi:8-oxo-dGTP diphosphatase